VADPTFWQQPCPWIPAVNNHTIVLVLSCILAGLTIISHIVRVTLKILADQKQASSQQQQQQQQQKSKQNNLQNNSHDATDPVPTLYEAYTRLVPFTLLNIGLVFWLNVSQADIVANHPRLYIWAFGMLMGKAVTELMIAHLCHQLYRPLSKTLAVAFFVMTNIFAVWLIPQVAPWLHSILPECVAEYPLFANLLKINQSMLFGTISEDVLLFEIAVLSFVTYANLIVRVIYEVTTLLGIRCFVITPKKQE
jgi:hypothetical protein